VGNCKPSTSEIRDSTLLLCSFLSEQIISNYPKLFCKRLHIPARQLFRDRYLFKDCSIESIRKYAAPSLLARYFESFDLPVAVNPLKI